MKTLLYHELVSFYHLLDPLEDHVDEAEAYGDRLKAAVPDATSLLELGSGAGHGAYYVKERFEHVTLADLSEAMLDRSKELNPDCEHVAGDMRSLRLGRSFDCVLIHDFVECHEDHAGDDDERSLRCVSWSHDPDPDDDTHVTDFACLLRERGEVRAVHDRHVYGLFATAVWIDVCREAGFAVDPIVRPLPDEYIGTAYTDTMFLCRKS